MTETAWLLPLSGVGVGIVMGFVARRYHFCTLGAFERCWYAGDSTRLRSWVLVALVAAMLTQLAQFFGFVDGSRTFYATHPLNLLGVTLGGLMFGIGMALVGTCGFGALIRLGGGSLRAAVALTGIALSALAAQRGITAQGRVAMTEPFDMVISTEHGSTLAGLLESFGLSILTIPTMLVVFLTIGYWIFRDAGFRADRERIGVGLVLGICVALGWLITSYFASIAFFPVQLEAANFVGPVGDALFQIVVTTGAMPDYAVGLVMGVVLGAAVAAWTADDIRWEACDDARELSRHIFGSFLMGTGGIMALGCTIGQVVSAASVFALSAPLAFASMALGARIGLSLLLEGSPLAFLRRSTQPAE
ncbi:YeeE/YedE family protein [Notoacmeibacter sp. MSK16QG-6]|uniref:YeeE/YedE family protein n=1 Tax=Notoacmeibacter sp. MSK16QG-6 TaxID=2957982 RepID=UPI0020A20D39|nr:YeeE/YedE family protein [Notoacmeibacter sp. MSK16QG-6]MCP1200808.1 YeeE/YedE family protein [Notoacmeibacter sp. MSK16QG-6]